MLKLTIVARVKDKKILIAQIADLRKVEIQSVERWVETNHPNLMHIKVLDLIAESLQIKNIRDLYE